MALVEYSAAERVARLTINRPEKRNALSPELVAALHEAFTRAGKDNSVKVVILAAHGEAFCAGADLAYLKQLQQFTFEENLADSRNLMNLFKLIYTLPKVVIAQVEGHALAGGSGLVTVCDFAYSVPEAKFGYTEVKIGFIPALVSVFMIRKVGEGRTRELLLSGRLISAEEANNFGMINALSEKSAIAKEVDEVARRLVASASSQSLAATKTLINQVQGMPLSEALEHAAKENAKARATDDCKKGIDAFLQKKDLTW
jgi:methylglutaconyl-CoA hydratase